MTDKDFWPGVKVFIGDQLCGTVNKTTNWNSYGRIGVIPVECDNLATGNSVRIEMEDNEHQLAISDVMAFSTLPRPEYLRTPSHLYSAWCSKKGRKCFCTGIVYYGSDETWWSQEVTGSIKCRPQSFPGNKNPKGTCKCFSTVVREYGETSENPFIFDKGEVNNQVDMTLI
jgi:hypothetical protein